MDLFSIQNLCSRTKLWLTLFGENIGHNLWRVPNTYAGYSFRTVLEWEMVDEEWYIDDKINAFIQTDWTKEDFEKIDKNVVEMELDRINTFCPLENLPKKCIPQLVNTVRIRDIVKSRWESDIKWHIFISNKLKS